MTERITFEQRVNIAQWQIADGVTDEELSRQHSRLVINAAREKAARMLTDAVREFHERERTRQKPRGRRETGDNLDARRTALQAIWGDGAPSRRGEVPTIVGQHNGASASGGPWKCRTCGKVNGARKVTCANRACKMPRSQKPDAWKQMDVRIAQHPDILGEP